MRGKLLKTISPAASGMRSQNATILGRLPLGVLRTILLMESTILQREMHTAAIAGKPVSPDNGLTVTLRLWLETPPYRIGILGKRFLTDPRKAQN